MTYNEYKALAEEYRTTDSISRKDELEEQLLTVASDLFKQIEKLHRKYGTSTITSDEWREDRGGYDISTTWDYPFDEHNAYIVYSDSWAYGGSCRIPLCVKMSLLDSEERAKLEVNLRDGRIKDLTAKQKRIDKQIEQLKLEREVVTQKLEALQASYTK